MKFGAPTLWDYKSHAALLRQINELQIDGVPLSHAFQIEGHNAWHWYQALLFESIKWRVIDGVTPTKHMLSPKSFLRTLVKLKLFSLLSLFGFISALIRRPTALLYSIDLKNSRFRGDQRIRPAYEAFAETNTKYIECFHAHRGRKTMKNWLGRRRNAFYLEGADIIFTIQYFFKSPPEAKLIHTIDFSGIPEADRALAKSIVKNALLRLALSRTRIRIFRRIFRMLRIRHVLLIDDPRHFWELIAAAEAEGIETTALQHGHYTKYQLGFFKFGEESPYPYLSPDALLVWSDYWKKELERFGSIFTNITVAGYKDPLPPQLPPRIIGEILRILVPYESVAPKEAVGEYLAVLAKDMRVHLIFKSRPDSPTHEQLQEYNFKGDEIEIMTALPKNPRDAFDIAVGTYTTLLSELIMQGIPLALLETPMDYGEGLVANGIAGKLTLRPAETLVDRIRAMAELTEAETTRRREVIAGDEKGLMKDAISRRIRN